MGLSVSVLNKAFELLVAIQSPFSMMTIFGNQVN